MFLNVSRNVNMTRRSIIPASWDSIGYSSPPRKGGSSGQNYSSGVSLVGQYIEYYLFRQKEYVRISDACMVNMHNKATAIDENLESQGIIDVASEEYPSCGSCFQAAIDLGYVNHVNGVGFISTDINDMKYFIRQYDGIVVELKAASGVLNYQSSVLGFELGAGSVVSEDVTKGFIACGYTSSHIYLQNNLGPHIGSYGFHRMSWSNFSSLALRGVCFKLT